MEILKGFVFDIQRFGDHANKIASTFTAAQITSGLEAYATDSTTVYFSATNTTTGTWGKLAGVAANADVSAVYDGTALTVYKGSTIPADYASALTVKTGTVTTDDTATGRADLAGGAQNDTVLLGKSIITDLEGGFSLGVKAGKITSFDKNISVGTADVGFDDVTSKKTVKLGTGTWTPTGVTATMVNTGGATAFSAGTLAGTNASIVSDAAAAAFTSTDGATFTAVAGVKVTKIGTTSITVTTTATDKISTGVANSTFEVNAAGNMTLTSGEFTVVDATADISVNGTVKVAGAEFSGATAVITDSTTPATTNTVVLTAGTMTLKTGHAFTSVTSKGAAYTTTTSTLGSFSAADGSISLSAGDVEATAATQDLSVNGVTFTHDANNATNLKVGIAGDAAATLSLIAGSITSTGGTYATVANAGGTTVTSVIVKSSSDGVTVKSNAGVAEVTNLYTKGETVTIGSVTYKATADGVVKCTGGANDGKYFVSAVGGATIFKEDGSGLSVLPDSSIPTRNYMTDATYTFNSAGTATSDDDVAATLKTGTSRSIEVSSKITKGVDTTSDTITVTDKGTDTEYTLPSKASVTAKDASFTVTDGVVSNNSKGTLTLVNTATALNASGTVNLDVTNVVTAGTATTVTYKAGSAVDGAKVTYSNTADKYFTLTEANAASSAEDTVYDVKNKTIKGVDADATITTNGIKYADLQTIGTTGSGTFTINNVAYTVADDSNGVTFAMSAATAEVVDAISELDGGATVKIEGKLSEVAYTINGTTAFTKLTASNGVTFTATDASSTGDATVTLNAKGDKVTYNGAEYEVTSMGGASDGVIIGKTASLTDWVGALNDGDTLKVTKGVKTIVYEANNSMLTVKEYATAAAYAALTPTKTTTYTLSDGETGFSVAYAAGTASDANPNVVKNGDAGETTAAATFGNTGSAANVTSLVNGMYINSNGETSLSENKAVAQINLTDNTATYNTLSDKGQTVTITGDTKERQDWVINTKGGKDTINYSGTTTDATISSGAGDDGIIATSAVNGNLNIDAGEGKDTVTATLSGKSSTTITAGAGNDVITATGTGEVLINADSGNNEITHTGTNGNATIVGGSGNDTITAAGDEDVVSGGDGKDVFVITGSSVKISDYSFGNDVIQVAAGTTPSVAMLTGDGKVSVAAGQVADISANAGDFYAADIKIGTDKAGHYAWAKEGGSNVDISSYSEKVVLKGDADGVNTLYTGAGNDTIVSLADSDSVFGGAGKDIIALSTSAEKRTVGISTTAGKDTVSGFKTGFSDADSLFMVDGAASDVKASYDATKKQVMFKDGNGSLQMESISAATSGAVELNVSGSKLAVLGSGVTANVDSATYADIFYGDNSAVNFSAVEGALNVNLANDLASSGDGAKYVGITSVTGGAGDNTLMGSAKANYIAAGTGKSSLYGGAGADTLVGGSESDMFFLADGTNTNTVVGFQTADKDTADTIKILGGIAGAKLNGSNVELSTSDGSKAVVSSMTANSMIKIESDNFTGVAKVGSASSANNFTYDKSVSYYGGGSAADKISVASGFSDNAEVWLDGSKGTAYASVDVVDFTNGAGNYVLAGDSSKNTIVGGKGDSSLWGGSGSSADSIKGGAGTNMFFWGTGEGNDSISSSNADDTVNLYTVKLSDVDVANSSITNSGVVLALNDGSKLTVSTSKDINFTVDGTNWTAVHSTKEWKQNS